MPDFSDFITLAHQDISAGFVETLIQSRREELFTGLARLQHRAGENFVFSFIEGVQHNLYRCHENLVDVLPRHIWSDALNHQGASIGFLRLSIEGLRFARLVYAAPVLREEKATYSPEELTEAATQWSNDLDASVVHVRSETVNKYYLIAGRSNPVNEELSFGKAEAQYSIADSSFPRMLPKTDYQAVRYVSNHEHEAWREYELRLAFSPLMRMMLNRFGDLGGRALTDRLCDRLTLWAHQGGYHITLTTNGVINKHYFDSLESAAGSYADLVRQFRQEAIPAIGSRMADSIANDTLNKFDPYRRELLARHVYGRPSLGSAARVAWR